MSPSPDQQDVLSQSEDLLRQAAQTTDMAERGRLIDQAAWLRFGAAEPEDPGPLP